jgi:hypothetical protein
MFERLVHPGIGAMEIRTRQVTDAVAGVRCRFRDQWQRQIQRQRTVFVKA